MKKIEVYYISELKQTCLYPHVSNKLSTCSIHNQRWQKKSTSVISHIPRQGTLKLKQTTYYGGYFKVSLYYFITS